MAGKGFWVTILNYLDMTFTVLYLACFFVKPRKRHLDLAVHLFGYLQCNINQYLCMDSCQPQPDPELNIDTSHPEFLEE